MSVAGEAGSGEAALVLWGEQRPDITIMDLRLPGMSGLDEILAIRREDPEARFIVLTSFNGDEHIHRALLAGVQGYLFKDLVRNNLSQEQQARLATYLGQFPALEGFISSSKIFAICC